MEKTTEERHKPKSAIGRFETLCKKEMLLIPKWTEVQKSNPIALELADRHYSRQKPGTKQFTRPGYNQVLLIDDIWGQAVFVWWRPKWESGIKGTERFDKLRCIENTMFRNESEYRSSDLIKAATIEVKFWTRYTYIPDGLITSVNSEKTKNRRGKNNPPGFCFIKAGWTLIEGKRSQKADIWLKAP